MTHVGYCSQKSLLFAVAGVCVECLIGKQNKPTLFKVTEPSFVPVAPRPLWSVFWRTFATNQVKKAREGGRGGSERGREIQKHTTYKPRQSLKTHKRSTQKCVQ